MPRRYGKRKRRNKRKAVTLSARQARTKRYDSRIEKVIARVARQEDAKQKQKLIYRQYLFGPYDLFTNVFGGGLTLDFDGVVAPLAQIQLLDNDAMPTIQPPVNPLQNPSTWVDPGANVVAPAGPADGFRRADWITIHGISLNVRAVNKALSQVQTPRYEFAEVHYRIILAIWEDSTLPDAKPNMNNFGCFVKRFGYSPKLDDVAVALSQDYKTKTIFKSSFKLRCNTLNTDVVTRNHYIDLSAKPLRIEYDNGDQNGRTIMRWKPFLVMQSQIPTGVATEVYKPIVHACTKLHYYDD